MLRILIDNEGTAHSFHGDATEILKNLGTPVRHRASHVVPNNLVLLFLFKILRYIFGDKGVVSEWTRDWGGEWVVDLSPSDGPVLGPFKDRETALKYEVLWLNEKYFS